MERQRLNGRADTHLTAAPLLRTMEGDRWSSGRKTSAVSRPASRARLWPPTDIISLARLATTLTVRRRSADNHRRTERRFRARWPLDRTCDASSFGARKSRRRRTVRTCSERRRGSTPSLSSRCRSVLHTPRAATPTRAHPQPCCGRRCRQFEAIRQRDFCPNLPNVPSGSGQVRAVHPTLPGVVSPLNRLGMRFMPGRDRTLSAGCAKNPGGHPTITQGCRRGTSRVDNEVDADAKHHAAFATFVLSIRRTACSVGDRTATAVAIKC